MKGNIITQRPAHNSRLLTISHLILPLYLPFCSFREHYQDYGDMVRKKEFVCDAICFKMKKEHENKTSTHMLT